MKIKSGFSEQTKAILWRVFMCMNVTFRRGSGSQCSTTKHSHPSIKSLSFPGKWHRGNVWRTHFIFSLTFYFTPLKRQLVSVRHLMENGKSLTGCAFNSPSQITSWAKPHCWENKPQFSFCCFLLKHVLHCYQEDVAEHHCRGNINTITHINQSHSEAPLTRQ